SRRIRCMAHKCFTICDESIIRNLVSKRHPDLAEKFDRFLLESYIEDNKMVKWCPSAPHCGNAIRVEEDEFCEVECSCVAYLKLILLVLVSCGNFGLRNVEMNQKQSIGSRWLCGGPTGRDHTWSSITGHSCGRYKEDEEKKSERAKRDLYRYMHYHNRYKAHTDSFKQESRLKETIRDKVETLEGNSQLRDFSWVTNGLYRLFRSRRALSYSYPFAFYMFGEELFGDEMTKEDLSIPSFLQFDTISPLKLCFPLRRIITLGWTVNQVITQESLLAAQREDLRRVMELLSLREHHARTLLIHYRWDVEKILAVLVEKGKSCLFSESGVPMLESHDPDSSMSTSTTTCDICMEDLLSSEMTKMDCGHCFCDT
ncbi:hypothetical protein M8C21_031483, partial [Ambrosia artemisiifolia]